MVELAFGVVLLLLLAAGAMDLGRAFFTYMALRDAAQEGAVYGSVCPTNPAAITSRVRTSSTEPVDLTDTSKVNVQCFYVTGGSDQPCSGSVTPGDGIKVRVTYNDFRITTPFLGAAIGTQSLTLSTEVTDTILRSSCP